jgi:hypothetical protein
MIQKQSSKNNNHPKMYFDYRDYDEPLKGLPSEVYYFVDLWIHPAFYSGLFNSDKLKEYHQNDDFTYTDIETKTSLLMIACYQRQVEVCKFLISIGVDVNLKNIDGENALMYAIPVTVFEFPDEEFKSDFVKIVNILIENGIRINDKNNHGCNALNYAISSNDYETIKILMKYGSEYIKKDYTNSNGNLYALKLYTLRHFLYFFTFKKINLDILKCLMEFL